MSEVKNNKKALSLLEGDYSPFTESDSGTVVPAHEAIRDAARTLVNLRDKSTIVLAEILHIIHSKEFFERYGFSSFEEYVREELLFQPRKAMYLIKIWRTLVIKHGFDKDLLRDKSWSKLKEIASAAEYDEIERADLEELIDESDTINVEEVSFRAKRLVSDNVEDDIEYDSTEKITRVTFNLYPGQLEVLESALDRAEEVSESEKRGANLEFVCVEFLGNHTRDGEKGNIIDFAKSFEGCTGKKILIADDDEVIYASKDLEGE